MKNDPGGSTAGSMQSITETTTIEELEAMAECSRLKDLFFTNPDEEKRKSRLGEYGARKGRLLEAVAYAAEASRRADFFLPLYTQKEIREDPALDGVCLLNFIRHPGKPICVICPGGGYNREWVLVEGYPMAQALDEHGFNSVILIYRTGHYGLLPRPLDDLARAVSWLQAHESSPLSDDGPQTLRPDAKNYDMSRYAVMGASAGGHLCAMWGTRQLGSRHYGLPSPSALLLMYPAANLTGFYDLWESQTAAGDTAGAQASAAFLRRAGGERFTRQDIERYSLDCLIDEAYPPVYAVHALDDPVVPASNTRLTRELLRRCGIRHLVRLVPEAGHSFGMGIGTDAEGWMEDAVRVWMG